MRRWRVVVEFAVVHYALRPTENRCPNPFLAAVPRQEVGS